MKRLRFKTLTEVIKTTKPDPHNESVTRSRPPVPLEPAHVSLLWLYPAGLTLRECNPKSSFLYFYTFLAIKLMLRCKINIHVLSIYN